ncbi:MAG: response regulator [Rhodobacteraceae bacterium]|nr:response regulator [Paracoccaceae bacterium]
MKYLIAEDDPNLRFLWHTLLTRHGHDVTETSSADQARAALEEDVFDVMLLDLYLGRASGFSLVRLAERLNPGCKVIIVAGAAELSDREIRTSARSVVSVHRKPVDIEDLLDVCGRIDRGSPLRRRVDLDRSEAIPPS